MIFNICKPEMISNQAVWNKTGQEETVMEIVRGTWECVGQVQRKGKRMVGRGAVDGKPEGNRSRGRSRT
jgi:hypothetical protein